jgi:hypothetical protein
MTADRVLVQVAFEGSKRDLDVIIIAPIPVNVDDLKKAILAEASIELAHCDAISLKVYPTATPIPVLHGTTALHPLAEISSLNLADDDTLIVVAPPPPPQVRNIPSPLYRTDF